MGVKRAAGENFFELFSTKIRVTSTKIRATSMKKERHMKFRIPVQGKELLDFYTPLKGGLFLTL